MNKRFLNKLFKIIVTLLFLIICLCISNKSNAAEDTEDDNPEFYGTTSITIRVNDELDLKSGMYRILAKDRLDGNITKNIKMISNNVNTEIIGNYTIEYEVTNSRNKKATIIVPVNVIENGERKIERTLYVLPLVNYLNNSQFYRGNMQDVQSLGIYLPANKVVRVRQINNNYARSVKACFYNGDSLKESDVEGTIYKIKRDDFETDEEKQNYDKYSVRSKDKRISINSEYTELKNETSVERKLEGETKWEVWNTHTNKSYDSIPVIRTIYGIKEKPVIEIILNDDVKSLDYFTYGDNDEEFKNKWRVSQNEYALLDGDRVQYIVPYKDLEDLGVSKRTTGEHSDDYRHDTFNKIEDIFTYYDGVVETYDEWIGLSYDAEEPYNKNVKTKFLIKVDKHGAGSAAYAYWRYINISDRTLDTLVSVLHNTGGGWLPLHEIGHGYQGYLRNKELYLSEISNNFFAYYFQQTELQDDEKFSKFDDEKCEKTIQLARETQETFLTTSHHSATPEIKNGVDPFIIRFFPYINLLNKIGQENALKETYKYLRKSAYGNPNNNERATDIIAKNFSEATQYNVIPYLEDWKLEVDDTVKSEIYNKDYPMVYYLKDLVENDLETIKNDLGLRWNYSLVSNNDIKKYNKKGNLTFNLESNVSIEQFIDKKILLKSGSEIVREIDINNSKIDITDIPIGIYEVEINDSNCINDIKNVVISENKTTTEDITVAVNQLSSIAVTCEPKIKNYIEGQNFDKTEMKVTATYDNGSSKEITNYTILDGNNLGVGKTSVTISYTENGITQTTTQPITVVEKGLTEIKVTNEPTKKSYIEGQNFDRTGMVITATYDNGSSKEITDYIIPNEKNLQLGQTNVTISYTENGITKTTIQNINVTKREEKEELYVDIKTFDVKEETEGKYLEKIMPNTTIETIKQNIVTNGVIEIYNRKGEKIIDKAELIATRMEVVIKFGNEEKRYTVVVKGDITGDGKMDISDLTKLSRHIAEIDKMTNRAYLKASDVYEKDGKYGVLTDLVKMSRVLAEIDNL